MGGTLDFFPDYYCMSFNWPHLKWKKKNEQFFFQNVNNIPNLTINPDIVTKNYEDFPCKMHFILYICILTYIKLFCHYINQILPIYHVSLYFQVISGHEYFLRIRIFFSNMTAQNLLKSFSKKMPGKNLIILSIKK